MRKLLQIEFKPFREKIIAGTVCSHAKGGRQHRSRECGPMRQISTVAFLIKDSHHPWSFVSIEQSYRNG